MRLTIGILISIIFIMTCVIADKDKIDLAYFIVACIFSAIPVSIGAYLQGYYDNESEASND